MTARILAGLAACCLASVLRSGPVEDAIVAAMRLSEQPNYSWVATVSDDARTYEIIGRTSQEGFSRVKMPVINSVRRRLGRAPTDNIVDAVFRGNVDCVLATDEGWLRVDELPIVTEPETMLGPNALVSSSSIFSSPTGRGSRKVLDAGKVGEEGPQRGYSNLQFAISPPHEELGVIISSGRDLEMVEEALTGNLTELGAKLLLVRDGQENITPLKASGSFTLWLRNGMVARYQVRLEGTLAIRTGVAIRQIEVRQTTSTIVQSIGTTDVDIPYEAMSKLGR